MASLEREILAEAKTVSGNAKLRKKDILAWSTGELTPEVGESVFYLPALQINVCVPSAKN